METELNHLTANMAELEAENVKLRARVAELEAQAKEKHELWKATLLDVANAGSRIAELELKLADAKLRADTDGRLGVKIAAPAAAVADDVAKDAERVVVMRADGSCPHCKRY